MALKKTKLRGDFVACSVWLLPDGSVRAVKFAHDAHQAWHAERAGQGDPHDPPMPGAIHLQTFGQIPAVDTPDGFPQPGMWWEYHSPKGWSCTVAQVGDFPIGNWHYHSRLHDAGVARGLVIEAREQRWISQGEESPDEAAITAMVPTLTVTPFEEPL